MIRTSLHNTLIFCASDIITETEEKSKWFFLFFQLFYQHHAFPILQHPFSNVKSCVILLSLQEAVYERKY